MREGDTIIMSIKPMGISNSANLLNDTFDNLLPYQYLRELVINGVEAGATFIQLSEDALGRLVYKDNGCGMSPDELQHFINNLAATGGGKEQGRHNNKGTGAKISTAPWNPDGVLVMSWQDGGDVAGEVTLVCEGSEYGLKQYEAEDEYGNPEATYYVLPEESYTPAWVTDSTHPDFTGSGTVIVLLGSEDLPKTYKGPYGDLSGKINHLKLNNRLFNLPANVRVSVWDPANKQFRNIQGSNSFFDKASESQGHVELDDVIIHWWLLKDKVASDKGIGGGVHDTKATLGCLYTDETTGISEIYNALTSKALRFGLINFGITEGSVRNKVVILVEPLNKGEITVWPDAHRKGLISDYEADGSLPLEVWGDMFRKNMPQEIKAALDAVASDETRDETKMREILKQLTDRLAFANWMPFSTGKDKAMTDFPGGSTTRRKTVRRKIKTKTPNRVGGMSKLGNGHEPNESGVPSKEFNPNLDMPQVKWVKPSEIGEDSADFVLGVEYNTNEPKIVVLNEEYSLFSGEFDYWAHEYDHANRSDVIGVVKWVYGKQICTKILHHWQTKVDEVWKTHTWETALSSESLTFSLLGLVTLQAEIKQLLSTKLGK